MQRRAYIGQHVRPACLFCLNRGWIGFGMDMYRRTFGWHLRMGRLKFLAAYPVLAALAKLRGRGLTSSPTPAPASPPAVVRDP
jgi:hypothetical protein